MIWKSTLRTFLFALMAENVNSFVPINHAQFCSNITKITGKVDASKINVDPSQVPSSNRQKLLDKFMSNNNEGLHKPQSFNIGDFFYLWAASWDLVPERNVDGQLTGESHTPSDPESDAFLRSTGRKALLQQEEKRWEGQEVDMELSIGGVTIDFSQIEFAILGTPKRDDMTVLFFASMFKNVHYENCLDDPTTRTSGIDMAGYDADHIVTDFGIWTCNSHSDVGICDAGISAQSARIDHNLYGFVTIQIPVSAKFKREHPDYSQYRCALHRSSWVIHDDDSSGTDNVCISYPPKSAEAPMKCNCFYLGPVVVVAPKQKGSSNGAVAAKEGMSDGAIAAVVIAVLFVVVVVLGYVLYLRRQNKRNKRYGHRYEVKRVKRRHANRPYDSYDEDISMEDRRSYDRRSRRRGSESRRARRRARSVDTPRKRRGRRRRTRRKKRSSNRPRSRSWSTWSCDREEQSTRRVR